MRLEVKYFKYSTVIQLLGRVNGEIAHPFEISNSKFNFWRIYTAIIVTKDDVAIFIAAAEAQTHCRAEARICRMPSTKL